jgi:hypothetical protein
MIRSKVRMGLLGDRQMRALDDPDQPLPDPINDIPAYDTAKQYITKRFTDQLLVHQIDYGLTLDALRNAAPVHLTFLSRNVEQLAQQCASLLERGIATRSEYEAVAEKDLETLTDLHEFLIRDAEFQNEATFGYYSLDYLAASVDETSAKTYVTNADALTGPVHDSVKPEAESERSRLDSLGKRTKYEENIIESRRTRAQAVRQSYALKVLSYAELNGPDNYPTRLDVLQRRFMLDFAAAALRFPPLYQGLKEIYGYDQGPLTQTSGSLFDDALIWLRNAAEFLVSFGASDQGYTLPVSVRSLVGDAWNEAFGDSIGQIVFKIDEKIFPDQYHVRLRGLSVYAVSSDPSALFSVALLAPQSSFIRHNDGTPVPVTQDAALTRIGRVQTRESMRDADIVGAVTLNNVSPFGQWKLGVTDGYPSLPNETPQNYRRSMAKNLEDIVVDFHVSVQPARH